LLHDLGHGVQERLFVLVVLVNHILGEGARRDGRDERFSRLDALERRLKVGDVSLHRTPVLPANSPGAHQPPEAHSSSWWRLEVGDVGAVAKNAWPHTLPCDDTSQTVFDVVGESRLALLPVTHHVHTSVDLLAHDLGHGATHPPCKGRVVVGLVCFLYAHHLQQVWRTCQTPGMGGENALGAALHSLLLSATAWAE